MAKLRSSCCEYQEKSPRGKTVWENNNYHHYHSAKHTRLLSRYHLGVFVECPIFCISFFVMVLFKGWPSFTFLLKWFGFFNKHLLGTVPLEDPLDVCNKSSGSCRDIRLLNTIWKFHRFNVEEDNLFSICVTIYLNIWTNTDIFDYDAH